MPQPSFTVPGMSVKDASQVIDHLQDRLVALIDLQLTLKHVHWNVVGPTFIGVHQMIDPQVDAVRVMVDEVAERIATLGGSPDGLAGNIVKTRSWDDYELGRAAVLAHLGALDQVYDGVVSSHREVIDALDPLDKVTQDLLIGAAAQLEQFHWFIRAHLENEGGRLSTQDADGEREAAVAASAPSGDGRPVKAGKKR